MLKVKLIRLSMRPTGWWYGTATYPHNALKYPLVPLCTPQLSRNALALLPALYVGCMSVTPRKSTSNFPIPSQSSIYPLLLSWWFESPLQILSWTSIPSFLRWGATGSTTRWYVLLMELSTWWPNESCFETSSTTSTATPTRHQFERRVEDVKISKTWVRLFSIEPLWTKMMRLNQVGNLSENTLWRTC